MEEENIEFIPDEIEETQSDDDLFNITSYGADPSVRELVTMVDEQDIVKPELQRKYVWKKKEASRFIESLLLGLPVPSIFLANQEDGKRLIIDGYQRINTLVAFMSGKWNDGEEFKLWNSELINERWRNKAYNELSDSDQRRLRNYTIHAIIFEQKHPKNDNAMFQIFERINTSGVTLNAQEIRNCVSQGKLNTLLFKLNKDKKWRILYGSDEESSRMLDLEFILRFLAMYGKKIFMPESKHYALKTLLNNYMSEYKRGDDTFFDELEQLFLGTTSFIYDIWGREAFFNLQNDFQKLRNKFYPTIYDSIMIATAIAMKRKLPIPTNLKKRRIELVKDKDYRNSITQSTMHPKNINMRVGKALRILYDAEL